MSERKEAVRAEECGNCLYWLPRTDHAGEIGGGYCRRFPPFFPSGLRIWLTGTTGADIEPSSGFLNDAWPNVHQQEWCGEFRARPQESDSER